MLATDINWGINSPVLFHLLRRTRANSLEFQVWGGSKAVNFWIWARRKTWEEGNWLYGFWLWPKVIFRSWLQFQGFMQEGFKRWGRAREHSYAKHLNACERVEGKDSKGTAAASTTTSNASYNHIPRLPSENGHPGVHSPLPPTPLVFITLLHVLNGAFPNCFYPNNPYFKETSPILP